MLQILQSFYDWAADRGTRWALHLNPHRQAPGDVDRSPDDGL